MPGLSAARIFKPCCLPVIEFYGIPILCAERHVSDAADLSPGLDVTPGVGKWLAQGRMTRWGDEYSDLNYTCPEVISQSLSLTHLGWAGLLGVIPNLQPGQLRDCTEGKSSWQWGRDLASLCLSCFLPPHPGAHDSTPLDLLNPTGVGFFIPKIEVMTPTLRAYHDCEASFGKYLEATKYWANANGCSYEISPWVPWPGRVLLEPSL